MEKTANVVAVYGAMRSGTTLLRLMLNAHPLLNCPGESDYMFDHLISDGSGGLRVNVETLDSDWIFKHHRDDYPSPLPRDMKPALFLDHQFADSHTGIIMAHRNAGRLLDVFPDMKIIHLIRDPRDVARSSIGMGWSGDVYYGATHWMKTEADWNSNAHRLGDGQVLNISYEDLVSQPEECLKQICAFLEVPYEDSLLSYDQDSTYSKPDSGLAYQWKRKQTPRQVGLIEGRIGEMLGIAGYEPSGHPVLVPGLLEKIGLRLADRAAVWKVKIKRYGLKDPVLLALAGKLRWPALGQGAKERMGDKRNAFLK